MSAAVPSPRRVGYLRIFLLILALLVVGLLVLLFGITMEATVSATGHVTVRGTEDVRSPRAGLIDLGWHEGEVMLPSGRKVRVRLDDRGNGLGDPVQGSLIFRHYQCEVRGSQRTVPREDLVYHKLEPGELLWPGQPFATVRPHNWWELGETRLSAPAGIEPWLAADIAVQQTQAVSAGQRLVTLAPVDIVTGQPRVWLAEMDVDEDHAAEVEVGQTVRIYSNLYNHRLHGTFDAFVERIDPTAVVGDDGRRRFHVVAVLRDPPLRLMLGSGFRAEIVLGRKRVYRIILEH